MHKTGETITADFTVQSPTEGEAVDADALPTCTLVINGTDDAAAVTVTNKSTGNYKASVVLPAVTDGDVLQIRVEGVVEELTGKAIIWRGVGASSRVADISDVSDKLDTMLEADGPNWRFTEDGLVQAGGISPQEVRDALKLAPSVGAADAGSIDAKLDTEGVAIDLANVVNEDATLNLTNTNMASVGSVTGNVGGNVVGSVGSVTALASAERDAIAAAILDLANAIDGKTPRQTLRYMAAALAGEISGAGTATEVAVGLDGSTTRVTYTVDQSGNRTAVAYD